MTGGPLEQQVVRRVRVTVEAELADGEDTVVRAHCGESGAAIRTSRIDLLQLAFEDARRQLDRALHEQEDAEEGG